MFLAFLPAFFIFGNGLGSYYFGRYQLRVLVTQVLVNLGYVHAQVPLLAALAVVSLILGCFAAAAAVKLMIVMMNQKRRDGADRSLAASIGETCASMLTAGTVAAMNLVPYWLMVQRGEPQLTYPAMLPAAEILLNGAIVFAAGRCSLKLVKH